jgi:hypothetical protein
MPDEVTPRFKPVKAEPRRRAWNSTLPAPTHNFTSKRTYKGLTAGSGVGVNASGLAKRPGKVKFGAGNFNSGIDGLKRSEVFLRAGGRCQADGLHHRDCPRVLDPIRDWAVHHVRPRSKGGSDELVNLIAVWAPTLGASGCHSRIHQNPKLATGLGLLLGRVAA